MSRISKIQIDDSNLPPPTTEIEQERKVAMFDLLEENSFDLPEREDRAVPEGPFEVELSIREKRLVFDIATEGGGEGGGVSSFVVAVPAGGQGLLGHLRELL